MKVEQCLKSSWHAYLIRCLELFPTSTVEVELPKSCIVERRSRIIAIAEKVENQLLNPAIPEHKSLDDKRSSELQAYKLCSKLAEWQTVVGQKWKFFPLRLPPRQLFIYFLHILIWSGAAAFSPYVRKSVTGSSKELSCRLNWEVPNKSTKIASNGHWCRGGSMLQKKLKK